MRVKQDLQRVWADQRTIATEDERFLAKQTLLKERPCHINGMTGSKLRHLHDELGVRTFRKVCSHEFSTVTDHEYHWLATNGSCCIDHRLNHGSTSRVVHDLREVTLHARALAGGKDDHASRVRSGGCIQVHRLPFQDHR
jgi:hypothetical protein